MTYARRVRKFTYEDLGNTPKISTHSLAEMLATRTSLSILPNLQDFTYATSFSSLRRFAILFMSESVRRFSFQLDDGPEPVQPFLDDISARMPYLKTLNLQTRRLASAIEEDFIRLLGELPRLEKIVVPTFHITSRVMETLANAPNLGVIEFQYLTYQGIGDKRDVRNFNPRFPKDGFPALWDVSLSAHLSQFIPLVAGSLAPAAKNLKSLYLHAISVDNEASVRQYFTVVGESFPLIASIHLQALPGPTMSTQWEEMEPELEALTLDTLKPLLNCPHLTSFELMHPTPLSLTLDDLETLTSKWPTLEVIDLNREPVILGPAMGTPSNLTLRALLPFARNCPNLRELGLYLHATETDLPSVSEIPRSFSKLTHLNFGLSSIREPEAVSLFLRRICPPNCNIGGWPTWPCADTFVDDASHEVMQAWEDAWDKVDSYLHLSEREVKDLRTQNTIPVEKSVMG